MERVNADPDHLVFIQSRAETNYTLVDEYAEMMRAGVEFDPAQGIRDESGQIYIWDGLHRSEAAKRAATLLAVEVHLGTKLDAEWLALTANQKHGLRRTREDLHRVVRLALRHPHGVNLSNREIARHCGVDDKTVGKIRHAMEASAEIPQIDARTVSRNGQTYQMAVGQRGADFRHTRRTDIQETEPTNRGNTLFTKYTPLADSQLHSTLKRALARYPKWSEQQSRGMTDQQLWDVIAHVWDEGCGEEGDGDSLSFWTIGGKNPGIWIGVSERPNNGQEPTYQGENLLIAVRWALDILGEAQVRDCHHYDDRQELTGQELVPSHQTKYEHCNQTAFAKGGLAEAPATQKPQPYQKEVLCPRCGERTVKLNGRALCLNQGCGARWETPAAFRQEVWQMEASAAGLSAPEQALLTHIWATLDRVLDGELAGELKLRILEDLKQVQ